MSLPASVMGSSRRPTSSLGRPSSPQLFPGSYGSTDASPSAVGGDLPFGSFRSHPRSELGRYAAPGSGRREPTASRSFVHGSHQRNLSSIDSAEIARSVREDTAELAAFALSDRASTRSLSPPRQRVPSSQSQIESYFDSDSVSTRENEGLRHETIQEISEPVSPIGSSSNTSSPGRSALAALLKQSPPSRSPPAVADENDDKGSDIVDTVESDQGRLIITSNGVQIDTSERTPLLGKGPMETHHPDWIHGQQDLEGQEIRRRVSWPKLRSAFHWPREKGVNMVRTLVNPKSWDRKVIWKNAVVAPVATLPAVLLGILLNILDGLSYGLILFPLGEEIFQDLGPSGIAMFYVSCIVSQLVYSCGGSIFKGGIGSEMIEVVPFFHGMAATILTSMGEDNPQAVIATTITSYAISSILTGLIFFFMGFFHAGHLIGFIPRHILIGCIGGVGWFLVETGVAVSAGMEGNFHYDWVTLRSLFHQDVVGRWLTPLGLAIFYIATKDLVYSRLSKYYLPGFIIAVSGVFYFFVFALGMDLPKLRHAGWIFEGPRNVDEEWYHFWTLYDFKLVNWGVLAETIPAMFALTFFGVLHVPINVPALGNALGEDDANVDTELIAHGFSNVISGCVGSIQNYLVYTNSIAFIKSGGNSRLAGIMLAIATFGVLLMGPGMISSIPVMMVGVLIFVLGIDLLTEALWDPRKKLKKSEYLTVVAIVLIMGLYDFVVGIFIGLGLAGVSLVFQASRTAAIRASYSGEVAGSTVRRNPTQCRYLTQVGQQIHVTKLAGYLFFGTIVSVESRIRALVKDEEFGERPIRFLIFDLQHVSGIDYSAGESFRKINRLCTKKGVAIIMSGLDANGPLGLSLRAVGLGEANEDENAIKFFPDLNSALENCENELLKTLYASKDRVASRNAPIDVPGRERLSSHSMDVQFSSPRRELLHQAATSTLAEGSAETRYTNFKEPLRLILQTFHDLTEKNEDFWFRAVPFFVRKEYPAGTILYHRGEPAKGFYLLEAGILRADYELPQGQYFESIVAGTTCGELPFFSNTDRTATVVAERDCICWLMDSEKWRELQTAEPEVAQELLMISLKLTTERFNAITSYVLTTAG